MKKCRALVCFVAMAATLAYGQSADEGYQPATVVSINRVPADAQHPENADRYKISMRLGNTIYSCHAKALLQCLSGGARGRNFPPSWMARWCK
jgi:hypothetical protein